jgi:glycosyltransferase involved in cell wall biosynthesis
VGRPRLLILGPLPPPIGGVETVTQAILESDKFSNFETRHVDMTKGRPKQTQGKFDAGNFRWAWIHFGRVRKALKEFKPDAVYTPLTATWSGFLRDAVIAWLSKRAGAKVLGHVHGAWFNQILDRKGWSGKIVRSSLRRFDALLMLGTRWKKVVEDYGYEGKVLIVPSTFRKEVFERGAATVHDYQVSSPGLFVGQVGKRKGVFDLLDALKLLKDEGGQIRIVLVGPGEFAGEWEALMEKRRNLGLEEVAEFTDSLQGEDLYKRFADAAFFVLPSYDEGLPVVYFEAGAFGLPAIGTPVGAIPDLLEHERNGLMVNPGDVRGLADALKRMSSSAEDRAKFGRALKAEVARFHPEEVCGQIAAAVETVLQGS